MGQSRDRVRRVFLLSLGFLGMCVLDVRGAVPEPSGWYAGDMHVHRSCGGTPVSVTSIYNTMVTQNLQVVSLLADMGNGEVQNPTTDLPLVNGADASVSTTNRIVHWDAEWHWDAIYTQYAHQALGGHIVALGLTNATQMWNESTYPILAWARQQGGVAGFAHFQFLDDGIPSSLSCCTPVEYPVEVALGACDFISEDINGSDYFIHAYYRLLNCGFRPGFAAGSDAPCGATMGSCVTFVQVPSGQLTYSNWIHGIASGRTVVSRNGRKEFLNLKVNTNAVPGDTVVLPAGGGSVQVNVQWSAITNLTGSLEIVRNGVVVTNVTASVGLNTVTNLTAVLSFTNSGWIVARRMNSLGSEHQSHTAAVFVSVNGQPVRTSASDALFYAQWMDTLLANTSSSGTWASYYTTNRALAQARYSAARSIFQQIAIEAGAPSLPAVSIGNGKEGGYLDNIYYNGAWINACRFQALSNMTVTGMEAKVGAVTGHYKCAIYSDNSGKMNRLLGSTVEVSNPAEGWQAFPLTSALFLTNSSYYWLAIWSDAASAKVYYSDTGGALSWLKTNYANWPDPITATNGLNFNYCIYAYGATGPVATNLVVGVLEDASTNLTLLGGGGTVSYAILSNPTNGTLGTLNTNTGAVVYTPSTNYFGVDSFRYAVSLGSQQATGVVSITVSSVNDAPTLTLASNNVVVLEDSGAAILTGFAVTSVGPANESGQSITNLGVLSVSNAALFAVGPAISVGGTLTFTPVANGNGVAVVRVQARDNGGTANGGVNDSVVREFTITITAVNDAPIAYSQSVTNGEDTSLGITLGGSDVDGPATNYVVLVGPTNGTLSGVAPDLVYRGASNYFGPDSFTFSVNDGSLTSGVATVTIVLTNINDAPIAYSQSVTNGEDVSFGITLGSSDADGPVTNYVVLAGPTNGTLSGVAPDLVYRGASNYFGPDSFTFSVNDGSLTSGVATVTIVLTNINDAPIAYSQSVTSGEDTSLGITLAGSDADGPVTNYVVLVGPTNGTLSGVAPDLVYRGASNYFSPDSFTFSVNDGSLTSGVATVTIVLTNINDAPVALSQSVTNGEDTSFGITLAGSDVDGPVTSYVVLAGPTNGTLSGVAPNLTYRGTTNYFGPDSFTFSVNDGSLTSEVATVMIVLTNINDTPIAYGQSVINGEDTSLGITLGGSDVDGPVTHYVVLAGPTNGTLSGVAPDLVYRGASNYFGPDSFTFSVYDGSLTSEVATVTIVLTNINDAPIAYSQSVTNGEDTSLGITLGSSDADGPVTNYVVLAGPTNGTLSGVAPDLVYRGASNYFGPDSFTFSVNDGSLTSGVATVTIVLTNINDAPVANDDSYDLGSGVVLEVAAPGVLSNDSDLEGESLTAVLVSGPLQGVLNLSASGGFSYTPTNHFSGADTFTYRSSDGEAESGLATVSVGVSNPIEILSVGVTNNQVMVTWTSIVGKGYRLQYKDSWADGGWTDILPEVIASGPTAIGTNAADAVIQRIYRVKSVDD